MENVKNTVEGISVNKKPSLMDKIKIKLSKIDDITDDDIDEKDSNSFFIKNKAIIIIAIAILSTFIVVNVVFKSIASSPVPKISESEGIAIMSSLYSTVWSIDDGVDTSSELLFEQKYKKIAFSKQLLDDGLTLPVKYYQEDNDSILGVEMGYLRYNREKQMLYAVLPNTQMLKFLYTEASASNIENITLVNDKNNRAYYIKNKVEN